ncbi:MAG: glycosyltransferase family 9 protein [Nitrospira sp.]|nr:glycosyltransferase family 9 protein [Nitrospira sp.]
MKQVLILNITRMGDLVQMGALLNRLQEEWPGASVDLVVDRRFASVAALMTGLRDVIPFDFHVLIDESRAAVKDVVSLYQEVNAWVRPLAERRYDRIINLTFNRPSALLAGAIGAADMRGARSAWDGGMVVDNPWMAYFCDFHQFRRFNRFNLVDVYALGGSGPGSFSPLHIMIPEQDRAWARQTLAGSPQWVAVQAGASDVMKAWRPHLFGLSLAQLSQQWHGGLAFIGGSDEEETIAQVIQAYREAGGRNSVKNLTGRTTLSQLAALLAECRSLLTNDTGPMHIGVAVGTSVIDLSVGHVDFQETGPYGTGHWVIQPELDCAPCGFEQVCAHHACKDRIAPDLVADLLLHVLKGVPPPSRTTGVRLYRSDVDEDGLGTFRLTAGTESIGTAWYAGFWRRYWYETYTGGGSRVPAPDGPPPDEQQARESIQRLIPLLTVACRKAEEIAHLAGRKTINIAQVTQLQHQQGKEKDRLVRIGIGSSATAPVIAAFLRQLQNDNVQGLDRLAHHHAGAYRTLLTRVVDIQRRCFGSNATDSCPLPGSQTTYAPDGLNAAGCVNLAGKKETSHADQIG